MNLNNYIEYNRNCPDFLKFVTEFLADTGIRPNELWKISKSNLSYIDGRLTYIQDKTGIVRRIKLSANILEKAREYRKLYGNFAKHFRTYEILKRDIFSNISLKFNLTNAHKKLYVFRYLYVLDKIKKGYSKSQISELLGHNDLTTVSDYIKHAEEIDKQCKKGEKENG